MNNLPKHIEHFDDERSLGNGVIVTLALGWSFYHSEHLGVMGFDTVTEARQATRKKELYRCPADCDECAFYRSREAVA